MTKESMAEALNNQKAGFINTLTFKKDLSYIVEILLHAMSEHNQNKT